MTAKAKLELVRGIMAVVESNLLDNTTGELKPLPDLAGFSGTIQGVMSSLTAAGVVIPDDVNKAVAGLVAVLAIV